MRFRMCWNWREVRDQRSKMNLHFVVSNCRTHISRLALCEHYLTSKIMFENTEPFEFHPVYYICFSLQIQYKKGRYNTNSIAQNQWSTFKRSKSKYQLLFYYYSSQYTGTTTLFAIEVYCWQIQIWKSKFIWVSPCILNLFQPTNSIVRSCTIYNTNNSVR